MAAHADSLLAINVKCNNLQVGNDDNHQSLIWHWQRGESVSHEDRQGKSTTTALDTRNIICWQGAGWQQPWWQPRSSSQLLEWVWCGRYQEIISLPSAIFQWLTCQPSDWFSQQIITVPSQNSHFSTALTLNFTFYHPCKQTQCSSCSSILAS